MRHRAEVRNGWEADFGIASVRYMAPISPAYLDHIFAERDELGQAWLSSAICGTPSFDQRQRTYGLPLALFLFVEDLEWFAQATRSGAWTYFEATSVERQEALSTLLAAEAPTGWADQYAFGMECWRDAGKMQLLDHWMAEQDFENTRFLWDHLSRYRHLVEELLA